MLDKPFKILKHFKHRKQIQGNFGKDSIKVEVPPYKNGSSTPPPHGSTIRTLWYPWDPSWNKNTTAIQPIWKIWVKLQ